MLRMEIALILILAFVAVMYFSAERKKSQLHKVFSILLVVVLVHFEWIESHSDEPVKISGYGVCHSVRV